MQKLKATEGEPNTTTWMKCYMDCRGFVMKNQEDSTESKANIPLYSVHSHCAAAGGHQGPNLYSNLITNRALPSEAIVITQESHKEIASQFVAGSVWQLFGQGKFRGLIANFLGGQVCKAGTGRFAMGLCTPPPPLGRRSPSPA